MNKYMKGAISVASWVVWLGLTTYADLVPEHIHTTISSVSERVSSVLCIPHPSSDDLIFVTSGALVGILTYLLLTKSKKQQPQTIDSH